MRKQPFNIENHLHHLTFSCYRRQALLSDESLRDALLDNWRKALESDEFRIVAFVVMPSHAHILIRPASQCYEVPSILRRLKEPYSRWLVKHWRSASPQSLQKIATTIAGKRIHRVWQKGGGFDRNLYTTEAINHTIEYIEFNPVEAGFVASPELWRWSSAFARERPSESLLTVDSVGALGIAG